MAGPDGKDFLNLQETTNKQKENEQKQYEVIMKKMAESPENLNKVDKQVMEGLDKHMQGNKDFATEMLFNCMEGIKKLGDGKLSNMKDKKSLNDIKEICLKHTTMEDVGAFQLKKEILTNDFTDTKLIALGKTYFDEWTGHWFLNIPSDYKPGSNTKIKAACEGKYFTEEQLVQTLYEKNIERRRNVINAFSNLHITDFIPENETDTKKIMKEIEDGRPTSKGVGTDILQNITRIAPIDGYWEYQNIIPQFIEKWEREIEKHFDKQNADEIIEGQRKNIENLSRDAIIGKITDEEIKPYYTANLDKLNEVVNLIKENSTNEKAFELYDLLTKGELIDFQDVVYQDSFTTNKYKTDGKIGNETLQKTREYLTQNPTIDDDVGPNIKISNRNQDIFDEILKGNLGNVGLLTVITLDIAAKLAKSEDSGNGLQLDRLRNITPEIATVLAGYSGVALQLDGLKSITPDVAKELAGYSGFSLQLDGLKSITPDVAKELAKFSGANLYLDGLESITPDIAKELAKFSGSYLYLDGLESITPEIATTLAGYSGFSLQLDGLKSITPDIAKELAKFPGDSLGLSGLENITPDVAKELAKFSGDLLGLSGLESITPDIAKELAKFSGPGFLVLNGLKSITPEIAKELAKFSGYSVALTGLESITPDVAKELAKFSGPALHLDGLKSITPEIAKELAKFSGSDLHLDGLKSITPEIAAELAKFSGSYLYFYGLESITPEIAKELAKFSGDLLGLSGLESMVTNAKNKK